MKVHIDDLPDGAYDLITWDKPGEPDRFIPHQVPGAPIYTIEGIPDGLTYVDVLTEHGHRCVETGGHWPTGSRLALAWHSPAERFNVAVFGD